MFEKVSRKKSKRYLREGNELLREDVRFKTLRLKRGLLLILMLTIRIHSEVNKLSIRKPTLREVVVTIWSQNGC